MVGNLSEVTQQVRDSGPVAQPPSRLPLSPSSVHMYFTQGSSKQTLCLWSLEDGERHPLLPRSQRSPGYWPAAFLSWGTWPSVMPVLVLQTEAPESWNLQGGGVLCSQSGWGHKHQGRTSEHRCRWAVGPAAHACWRVDGCAQWRIEHALPPRKTSAELGCLFLPYFNSLVSLVLPLSTVPPLGFSALDSLKGWETLASLCLSSSLGVLHSEVPREVKHPFTVTPSLSFQKTVAQPL